MFRTLQEAPSGAPLRPAAWRRRIKTALAISAAFAATAPAVAQADIYWGTTTGISRADADGSNSRTILGGQSNVVGLGMDDADHLYFSRQGIQFTTVQRVNKDGSGLNSSFITGTNDVYQITSDATSVYWGAFQGSNTISKAPRAGGAATRNFITGQIPIGVAVTATKIYWTDEGTNAIVRANIDGTNVERNFITGASNPGYILVEGPYIYWTNRATNSIARANLDGSNVKFDFIIGGQDPFGLGTDGAYLYWSNTRNGTIGRATLGGCRVDQSFLNPGSAMGLAVDRSAQQSDCDNDGVGDNDDAFPTDPNEWSDADQDQIGDNADDDDDNDGVLDGGDSCPTTFGTAANGCPMPTKKEECMNYGFKNYGATFRNQGDCVSYIATRGKNQPAGAR